MIRRLPPWLLLAPLALAALAWYLIWDGYRDAFVARVQQLLPGTTLTSSGFPYRLEVETGPVARDHSGDLVAALRARRMMIDQQPWQADRQILSLEAPVAALGVSALAGIGAHVRAPFAQASIHRTDGIMTRLSIVWERPHLTTGLLAGPLDASALEAHFRETPASASSVPVTSPRPPTQAQLVLAATGLRWRGGDPVTLALTGSLTGWHPITSYAAWSGRGTFEIDDLRLSDQTGEVLTLRATLVPAGSGRLRIAGVIDTLCPATVRAVAAGRPAPVERRARRMVRLAFSGIVPGAIALPPADAGRPPPPVRGQQPPCPRLAG